jgi:hypothetical protein
VAFFYQLIKKQSYDALCHASIVTQGMGETRESEKSSNHKNYVKLMSEMIRG